VKGIRLVCVVITCAGALSLTACQPKELSLAGMKLQMTVDEARAVRPNGADRYCLGGGDSAFEQRVGFPASTTGAWCTWSMVGADGKRAPALITVGDTAGEKAQLRFDRAGDGQNRLVTFTLEVPNEKYDQVEHTLSSEFGSPKDSVSGPLWRAENGEELKILQEQGLRTETVVLLDAFGKPDGQ
jgi:hypothetical protein